jgi:hypothetical protein
MGGHAAEPSTPVLTPRRHGSPCGVWGATDPVTVGAHGWLMWTTPRGDSTAPPPHVNQALVAGSETRRRSVDGVPREFLGGRLLKE